MKTPYDIIIKPVLTEKSYADMADKKFTFQVAVGANKTEIKQALESIFEGVKIEPLGYALFNPDGTKKTFAFDKEKGLCGN